MVHDALKMLPIFSCYCVKNDRTLLLFRKGKTGNKASDVYVCSENIPQQKKEAKNKMKGEAFAISVQSRRRHGAIFCFWIIQQQWTSFVFFFFFFYKTFLSYLYLFSE